MMMMMMHWIDSPTRVQSPDHAHVIGMLMMSITSCSWKADFLSNPKPNVTPFLNPKPLHSWPCNIQFGFSPPLPPNSS